MSVTLTATPPTGGVIVIEAVQHTSDGSLTASDSENNTYYTLMDNQWFDTPSDELAILFAPVTTPLIAGDTITVQGQGPTTDMGIWAAFAAGVDLVDQTNGAVTTFTLQTSQGVVTGAPVVSGDELLFAAGSADCTSRYPDLVSDAGFVEEGSFSSPNAGGSEYVEALFEGAVGSGISGLLQFSELNADAGGHHCSYSTLLATFFQGVHRNPSGATLAQTPNSANFALSWQAGEGNGGAYGCLPQYLDPNNGWQGLYNSLIDCDVDAGAVPVTLPLTSTWLSTSWSGPIPVRMVRLYDYQPLVTFPQELTCTPEAGSPTPTPTIDEDCDGNWDNEVCASYAWIDGGAGEPGADTMCADAGIGLDVACGAGDMGSYRYTDGLSNPDNPAQTVSSSDYGTQTCTDAGCSGATCAGDYAGGYEWICTGAGCLFY